MEQILYAAFDWKIGKPEERGRFELVEIKFEIYLCKGLECNGIFDPLLAIRNYIYQNYFQM